MTKISINRTIFKNKRGGIMLLFLYCREHMLIRSSSHIIILYQYTVLILLEAPNISTRTHKSMRAYFSSCVTN